MEDAVRQKPYLQEKLFPPEPGFDKDADDQEAFEQAMQDVHRIPNRTPRVLRATRPPAGSGAVKGRKAEASDYELFMKALEGGNLELFHLNEYVEGGRQAWDTELLRKLRDGGFSVQAELDLHGLDQREAIRQLESFIEKSRRSGFSCVRIIHGKGKNSPKDVPILKNRVQRWLSRRGASRHVVAYTSARPVDGGGGALYVLLRKVD